MSEINMKNTIQKHIDKQNYVKVYICDHDGAYITNFNGFILAQNAKHVLICNTDNFFYDGVSIIRKADIDEIRRTENEKFFQKILEKEGLKGQFLEKSSLLKFELDTYQKMFESFYKMKIPVILEAKYKKDDRFIIGPVMKFDDKKVKINHFNSRGEYDLKFVPCKYKEITYITIDSPYANTFYKYVKTIQ
jgi:hypothetical protein